MESFNEFPLPPNLEALAEVLQKELGGFEDEDSQPMPDLKTTDDVLHYWNNALEKVGPHLRKSTSYSFIYVDENLTGDHFD